MNLDSPLACECNIPTNDKSSFRFQRFSAAALRCVDEQLPMRELDIGIFTAAPNCAVRTGALRRTGGTATEKLDVKLRRRTEPHLKDIERS